jgi:hypothetical protein
MLVWDTLVYQHCFIMAKAMAMEEEQDVHWGGYDVVMRIQRMLNVLNGV